MPVQAENVASLGTAAHAHHQHNLRDQWAAPLLESHMIAAVSAASILLAASNFNFVFLNIFHVGSAIELCCYVAFSAVSQRKNTWRQMMAGSRGHRNVVHVQANKPWTSFSTVHASTCTYWVASNPFSDEGERTFTKSVNGAWPIYTQISMFTEKVCSPDNK